MAEEYLMDSALLVDPDGQGLNENCKCTICHNVFNQPKACGSCLNHFCSRCIGRWLTSHSRECPLCKHYVEMRPVPLLLSILSKLQFRCVHNENGCQEVCGYDSFVTHAHNCQYKVITCRFTRCSVRVLRKDMGQHEANCPCQPATCQWCSSTFQLGRLSKHIEICEEREEKCTMCSESFRYQEFLNHKEICPNFGISCRWCRETFLRKEHEEHESMCEDRKIKCTGCHVQMPMNQLYLHQNSCEEYPTVCQHCSQVIPRKDFATHTLVRCIEFIKNQCEQRTMELRRENDEFRRKLKLYRGEQRNLLRRTLERSKALSFSLFKKDSDIFVSGPLAAVRQHKKKRKDRYVLLDVDRLQNKAISWRIKVLSIKSEWFAVGLSEESNLYLMRRYQTFGHCTCNYHEDLDLVSANGMLYCTHDESQNQRQADFRLYRDDEVLCEYLPAQRMLRVTNLTRMKTATVALSLEEIESKSYYPCVCLRCGGESAELLEERAEERAAPSEEGPDTHLSSSDIDSI